MNRGKKALEIVLHTLCTLFVCITANCAYIVKNSPWSIPLFMAMLVTAAVLPLYSAEAFPNTAMKICSYGTNCLKIFLISTFASTIYLLAAISSFFRGQWILWIVSVIVCFCVESIIFWIGIISVYCTSIQLGIKYRVLGIAFGMVPIVHIIMLGKIIRITTAEIHFEIDRHKRNMQRRQEQICHTRYPILLVHGVFLRDCRYFNYWGRIPKELSDNGAQIYYGEHQSASSIESSALELAERIKSIVQETGCEKVNIIAHSKGGLDCRYAISHTDAADYIASLTTINTPHRGCKFADYLLNKIPNAVVQKVADTYNAALRKFGDQAPDFISAVRDLTSERCRTLDQQLSAPKDMYCSSVGSKLNHAASGKFPLNFSYPLVKYFDGPNDGLVGEDSFRWGEKYTFLTVTGKRGISHGDMIDLNRENIPEFDVREFYVRLVSDLKERGL